MKTTPLILILLLWSCASAPEPAPIAEPENVPESASTVPATPSATVPDTRDLLTEYDIWDFLSTHPDQQAVRETLGAPDSVWVDEDGLLQIWYYYVPEIQDYNSVEFDPATQKTTGFEWD
ncbi:MAG: hypothetical protein ACE5D1_07005 [Fidelibacterota bacterium]